MRNPFILSIISYKVFPPEMGGQKCAVDFYSGLAKRTKVWMAASKENKGAGNEPLPVLAFLYNQWWGPLNIFKLFSLRKLIVSRKIDVIVIEHSYFGWIGMILRWMTKKPFVIRSQNIEALRFRDMRRKWWWIYAWYERRAHRGADYNFFISPEDLAWALENWQLDPSKCTVVSHGITMDGSVALTQRIQARQQLTARYRLSESTRLFFFNGSFDYMPNIDALRIIVSEILPLLRTAGFHHRIILCGKGLDDTWKKELRSHPSVIYEGFVDDLDLYYNGTDCFINPVTLGGGIKIKLLEALAHDQTAISTQSGAKGVADSLTGNKLIVADDYDWKTFATCMMQQELNALNPIPDSFRAEFDRDRIIDKALLSLQALCRKD